jgi:hypothetical protein
MNRIDAIENSILCNEFSFLHSYLALSSNEIYSIHIGGKHAVKGLGRKSEDRQRSK